MQKELEQAAQTITAIINQASFTGSIAQIQSISNEAQKCIEVILKAAKSFEADDLPKKVIER